jgi:predicted secreted protein with PEFG-CTERM motif
MKAHLSVFALSAILIASIGMTPAFGQSSVVVTTDKASYSEGETILVTGEVAQLLGGYALSLTVIAPNGNLVSIDQLTVGADKKFSTSLAAGGALMKIEGTYTVTVQYGDNKNNVGGTTFEFGGSTVTPPSEVEESTVTDTTVSVSGSSDLIGYTITGGKLLGIVTDFDANSLIISIQADEDGSLTLTIPRSVLDATINGEDDDFFVLVDGEEVDFDETTTSTDRILTIAFPAGAEEIEIIGTFVVPEFGTIAVMILAVAIISIIAISAKSRLSIIPRY